MESSPGPSGGWYSRLQSGGHPPSVAAKNTACSSLPRFPFLELTEELQHHVLSFIADAPFESLGNEDANATLTGVLPLVSKHFQKISRSNLLWKAAFYRAIESDDVWKRAARNRSLQIPSRSGNDDVDFRSLYRRLYHEEIAFAGPVFVMGMEDEEIPERYSLYLFEPRYRLMVERLLNIHDEWQRNANANEDSGSCPPLYFLHAHRGLGCQGGQPCVALLVEIIRCMGMPTGHYDVTLQVNAIVRLERFWIEPNTGHLYHAYGRKIQLV